MSPTLLPFTAGIGLRPVSGPVSWAFWSHAVHGERLVYIGCAGDATGGMDIEDLLASMDGPERGLMVDVSRCELGDSSLILDLIRLRQHAAAQGAVRFALVHLRPRFAVQLEVLGVARLYNMLRPAA